MNYIKIIFICILLVTASSATAATIVATPKDVVVREGSTFSIRYTLDPQKERNYTTKLILYFSPSELQVESIQFASNWIALSQPGYDLADQVQGTIIKTAGYPGGIATPTHFLTVQFRAIGTKQSTISVREDSFVLDARNEDVLVHDPLDILVKIVSAPKPTLVPGFQGEGPDSEEEETNLFDVSIQAVPGTRPFPYALILILVIIIGILILVWHKRKKFRNALSRFFKQLNF